MATEALYSIIKHSEVRKKNNVGEGRNWKPLQPLRSTDPGMNENAEGQVVLDPDTVNGRWRRVCFFFSRMKLEVKSLEPSLWARHDTCQRAKPNRWPAGSA